MPELSHNAKVMTDGKKYQKVMHGSINRIRQELDALTNDIAVAFDTIQELKPEDKAKLLCDINACVSRAEARRYLIQNSYTRMVARHIVACLHRYFATTKDANQYGEVKVVQDILDKIIS